MAELLLPKQIAWVRFPSPSKWSFPATSEHIRTRVVHSYRGFFVASHSLKSRFFRLFCVRYKAIKQIFKLLTFNVGKARNDLLIATFNHSHYALPDKVAFLGQCQYHTSSICRTGVFKYQTLLNK